jgi:hypothetical protein
VLGYRKVLGFHALRGLMEIRLCHRLGLGDPWGLGVRVCSPSDWGWSWNWNWNWSWRCWSRISTILLSAVLALMLLTAWRIWALFPSEVHLQHDSSCMIRILQQ